MVTLPNASCSHLSHLVRRQAERRPDDLVYVVLDRNGREAARITYGELDRWARRVAVALKRCAAPGDRALLAFPTSVDFFAALFGCAYAGIVAVPMPPSGEGAAVGSSRMASIIIDAEPSMVLTTPEVARNPAEYGLGMTSALAVADLRADPAGPMEDDAAGPFEDAGPEAASPAFIQYTSGSTSEPKGVVVSHRSALVNMADIANTIPVPAADDDRVRAVSWLPLFHDMGLAQALFPMLSGGTVILISPVSFMVKPVLWVEAISRYRAQLTTAPNFGYDLCARRVTEEKLRELDLSHWRIALNGSESVRVETIDLFARTFAPAGFDPAAFVPCYGLAEGTFYVSGNRGVPRHLTVSVPALERESVVRPPADDEPARKIVSCGPVAASLDVRIVDPVTRRECEASMAGEIWVAGDSVSAGYWRRADGPFGARLAAGPERSYLRTSDVGFMHEGELYVLGRFDDVIVLYGRNHYPQDIELTAQLSHDAIAPGRVAAFSYRQGEETAVAVVAETARRVRVTPLHAPQGDGGTGSAAASDPRRVHTADVVKAVRAAVSADHQIRVAEVILLHPAGLPRTTSGKVRRRRCRELFLVGELKTW